MPKLEAVTDLPRAAQDRLRVLTWWSYADLKACRTQPSRRRRSELRARFDGICRRRTGFATPGQLLKRLHANKEEFLRVLAGSMSHANCGRSAGVGKPSPALF